MQLVAHARADKTMRRPMKVPGIGPVSAHAIVAAIGEASQFNSARGFATLPGLTPREHQSANGNWAWHISRIEDPGVQRQLTLDVSAVMLQVRARPEKVSAWTRGILV